MKKVLKDEVISIIVTLRKEPKAKFNALLKVLINSPKTTASQKRYYNSSGFSPSNLSSIEYDLKKIFAISDKELHSANKVIKLNTINVVAEMSPELKAMLQELDLETADYNKAIKPAAKGLSEFLGLKLTSLKKVDLIAFINSNFTKAPSLAELIETASLAMSEATEDVKTDIKLRDQFPFLSEEDCPDEFKILVADKLTAYIKYKEGRAEIKAALEAGLSEADLFEIAKKTVENFELNLEIYDELHYYKEHGQILGTNTIFADKVLEEKVNTYSTVELTKRQKNLRTYKSRDQKVFDKLEDGPDKETVKVKLDEWKAELTLVDARLDKIS